MEKEYKVKFQKMAGKSKKSEISKARAVLSYIALEYIGKKGTEIGKLINKSPGSISQLYQRGERIIEEDPVLMGRLTNS